MNIDQSIKNMLNKNKLSRVNTNIISKNKFNVPKFIVPQFFKTNAQLPTQKRFWSQTKPNQHLLTKIYKDTDGDKVPDKYDCQPNNKKKHMGVYLSTKYYGTNYGQQMSHKDVNPRAYYKGVEEVSTINQYDDYFKNQAVRLGTEKDADSMLSFNINNKKINTLPKQKVVVWVDPQQWEESMEDKQYRKTFMKGINATQKVDKYNNDVSVFNQEGEELGTIGSLKDYYEETKANDIFETKYIPVEEAYNMRNKSTGSAGMEIHRSDSTLNTIKDEIRQNKMYPIQVSRNTYNEGRLDDGKHRILMSQQLGKKTVPIQIERDDLNENGE
jgi:hypothetical protein